MNTHVIPTHRPRRWRVLGTAAGLAGAIVAVLALLGLGQRIDDTAAADELLTADQAQHEAELQAAYQLGRARGHADMVDSAQAAWQSAQAEADRCRSLR